MNSSPASDARVIMRVSWISEADGGRSYPPPASEYRATAVFMLPLSDPDLDRQFSVILDFDSPIDNSPTEVPARFIDEASVKRHLAVEQGLSIMEGAQCVAKATIRAVAVTDTSDEDFELRDLGPEAVRFLNDRIASLWCDQDGLHARVKQLTAEAAFGFLREPFDPSFEGSFKWSNPSGNGNRDNTAALVRRWMSAAPAGRRRGAVIEDRQGRREDGNWAEYGDVLYIDTPYAFSFNDSFGGEFDWLRLSVGAFEDTVFLIEVPDSFSVTDPLSEAQIAEVVDGVVGVAAWCWDDEGLMVAGIGGRWDPRDWA